MKTSKIIMIVAALLPTALFFLPMWTIQLSAPQYPEPLGMEIFITKIAGEKDGDLQNINLMNHYVGMKEIPEHIPEFEFFPWIVGGMIVLGVVFGLIGNRLLFLLWFWIASILGCLGMYDFYQWEYDYGTSLDPKAAIKFMDEAGQLITYQPPLIGTQTILNFEATSLPAIGAYILFLGMALSIVAYWVGRYEAGHKFPPL
ncbi:MAG: hypothetical protein H6601_06880 [Flavobacteriales bacterium]|nr:hypothetical protein [Flavobacteriales bacterium]